MQRDFKPLCEDTKDDAATLICDRFDESALSVFNKFLAAPARVGNAPIGCVGYKNGVAVCMQAEMPRRMYMGRAEIRGLVGGLTCKVQRGCPLSLLLETIDKATNLSGGYDVAYGNSCCREAASLNEVSDDIIGPESCARYLWRAVRPIDCIVYFMRRKLLKMAVPQWPNFSTLSSADFEMKHDGVRIKRTLSVEPDFFDALMAEYLKTNRGLVCSRSAAEVDWMFGKRIKEGHCVLLCGFNDKKPAGYIVLGSNSTAKRWMLMDAFSLGNNHVVLEALLSVSCYFLKKKTPAMMLETSGFPTWVQPLLKRYMPHERHLGNNMFVWNAHDRVLQEKLLAVVDTPQSWFFGPYDGDLCM